MRRYRTWYSSPGRRLSTSTLTTSAPVSASSPAMSLVVVAASPSDTGNQDTV